jgi:hypothetical protein
MSRTIEAIMRHMAASAKSGDAAGRSEQQSTPVGRATATAASSRKEVARGIRAFSATRANELTNRNNPHQETTRVATTSGKDLQMKTKLMIVAVMVIIAISPSAEAGPNAGGFGGGHFGGGFGGAHFSGGHFGASPSGGFRAVPGFYSRGAYFTGRSVGGFSRPSYAYSGDPRMSSADRPRGKTLTIGRSAGAWGGRVATANRQPNRVGSMAGRNGAFNSRTATSRNPGSFSRNHVFARHDGNWHRDWDRHHAHFWNGHWWTPGFTRGTSTAPIHTITTLTRTTTAIRTIIPTTIPMTTTTRPGTITQGTRATPL